MTALWFGLIGLAFGLWLAAFFVHHHRSMRQWNLVRRAFWNRAEARNGFRPWVNEPGDALRRALFGRDPR